MEPQESQAVFAIAAIVIMSLIYFLVLDKIKSVQVRSDKLGPVCYFVWRKISGFLLLGVGPAVSTWAVFELSPLQLGMIWGETGKVWPWVAGASLFFAGLNIFNSKNRDIQAAYPEMRLSSWNLSMLGISSGGWMLYLAGYEYLFRGLLLFSCYDAFGLWPAAAINLALYSALHLPKGMKEAMAAIPFGALLCFLTLESHSILPALIIHFFQAFSCEVCCIIRNKEMEFTFFKRNQP